MASSSFAHRVESLITNSRLQLELKKGGNGLIREKSFVSSHFGGKVRRQNSEFHQFDGQFGQTGGPVMRVFTSGWKRLRFNPSAEQREKGRYVKGSNEWDTGCDFAAKTSAVN